MVKLKNVKVSSNKETINVNLLKNNNMKEKVYQDISENLNILKNDCLERVNMKAWYCLKTAILKPWNKLLNPDNGRKNNPEIYIQAEVYSAAKSSS